MAGMRSPQLYGTVIGILMLICTAVGFYAGKAAADENALIYSENLIGRFGASVLTIPDEQLRQDAAFAFTGKVSEENISAGRKYLTKYGYDTDMPLKNIGIYRDTSGSLAVKMSAIVLISLTALCAAFLMIIFRIKKELDKIGREAQCITYGNQYSEDVRQYGSLRRCSGAFSRLSDYAQTLRSKLEKSGEYNLRLLSDISHQMKTPVAALKMNNEIMQTEKDMTSENREKFIEKNLSQIDRLEWLTAGLLKSARLDSGAIEFDFEEQSLYNAIQTALLPYTAQAREKSINIEISVPAEIKMEMDIRWLAEALGNIIKNSIEHTQFGGHIKIEGSETPLTAVIIISDDGEGIDKTMLPRIFDRFFTGSRDGTSVKSVGIGLSIAKSITERHNGSIRASSGEKGTSFTITFLKTKAHNNIPPKPKILTE